MTNFKIDVIRGNIVNITADAIVNSANNSLERGTGSNKTIFDAAGIELVDECRKLEFCETGKAVVTKAYKAPAHIIIHAVTPYWHGGYNDEAKKLASCYIEIMKKAQENFIETISMPLIGTGDGGYPLEEAAEIAISTIKSYIANNNYNVNVRFMCVNTDVLNKLRTANEQSFIDISKYLSRHDIRIETKLKIEEQSYLKGSFFKKQVSEQQKNTVVMMVLKRKLKIVEPNAIFLPKITSDKLNDKIINKHEGKTGPYVTSDCISSVEFSKNRISIVINPVCIKKELETKALCNLTRNEELRKAEMGKKEENQNYYKDFNIEKVLKEDYKKDYQNRVVELSNDFSNPDLGLEKDFDIDIEDKYYTGKEIVPSVKSNSFTEDDYFVECDNNIQVGQGTVFIKGKGQYTGTIIRKFNILKYKISEEDFIIDDSNCIYNGKEQCPDVTADVINDKDFEIKYENNINAGTADIIIKGIGNCTGEIIKHFEIKKCKIGPNDFNINNKDYIYTGVPIIPMMNSEIPESEYDIITEDNIDVGIAKLIIVGKNNYYGKFVTEFQITERSLETSYFIVDTSKKTYNGKPIIVDIKTPIGDENYVITYDNNINAGIANLTIKGRNNYKGELKYSFQIKPCPISKECFIPIKKQMFTSKPITPQLLPINKLIREEEYDIEYDDNINVGIAKIKVKGKGNFCENTVIEFEIIPKLNKKHN